MIELHAVKLPKHIEKTKFNNLILHVPEERQVTIKRFIKIQDSLRTLTGEILTRCAIRERTKLANKEVVFAINKYGKPYVKNVENLQFNVSHSGEWVVCAVDTEPIGIDIEIIKSINLKVAKRFFSQEEYRDFVSKDENGKTSYFYDLWTLKESYIKAVGRGLSIPLNTITIQLGRSGINIKNPPVEGDFYFKQYWIDDLYKLSVCSTSADFPDFVTLKSIKEIIIR